MFRKKKQSLKNANALLNARSPFAYVESYKSMRTNLEFSTFDGEIKTILFSSSVPNEGKTSVVINTAQTLAESDHKVLLIDADLRSPFVGRYLRIRQEMQEGLSTILSGKSSYKTAIYEYVPGGFDVLLSGPIPPNPTELLSRKVVSELMEELKEQYDYILIDTPPVGVVSDATTLSAHVDGAVFVVRNKYTKREVAQDALKTLKASGIKVLGAILNDYDASEDVGAMQAYEYTYHYDPKAK